MNGLRSMTGFGAAALEAPGLQAAVQARSVNHRFLDLSIYVPRRLAWLEPQLKATVQERVQRGKLELSVRALAREGSPPVVAVQEELAGALVGVLRGLQQRHGLSGELRVADVARFPGVVEVQEPAPVEDPELAAGLLALARRALDELDAMRRQEGQALAQELGRLLDTVEQVARRLATLSDESREMRRAALLERLRGLAGELGLDDARVYQEAVRQAERSDVAEELQRLGSHVAQARELLTAGGPVGKKLDFLAQELMREANTVGSKAAAASMLREVVELKAVIERLREQVQNVE